MSDRVDLRRAATAEHGIGASGVRLKPCTSCTCRTRVLARQYTNPHRSSGKGWTCGQVASGRFEAADGTGN